MNRALYATIPASVRYDKRLTANAKLMYGEITALCTEKGFCWATNQYFEELYGVSETTIQRWINALVSCGYIGRYMQYEADGKTILNRCLTVPVAFTPSPQKWGEGTPKNDTTPPPKNGGENNINNNNPSVSAREAADILSTFPDDLRKMIVEWANLKNLNDASKIQLILTSDIYIKEYGAKAVTLLIRECIASQYKGIVWDKLYERKASQERGKPSKKDANAGILRHEYSQDELATRFTDIDSLNSVEV